MCSSSGLRLGHDLVLILLAPHNSVFEAIEVSGGYQFRYFDSDGREWKHTAHVLSAGMDFALPLDFRVGTYVNYEHRDFSNPSTFPDREVIDELYGLSSADRKS